ncbi:MAG: alpha/beta hydrolase, partial [Myxococcales bacterium]|nr:alpha/beta hydrolase [Myxococcales bacterium]
MTADATAGVGVRDVPCHDPVQATAVPLALLYPTTAATAPTRFGPYPLDVARDADVAGDALPLVVVSHGNGGSPWAYRGLAAHLVGAGLAVAMVEHPGNSRRDNALAGTDDNLRNR